MVKSETQPSSASEGTHLLLYDGVCGLCSRLLQFVLRHDQRRVFNFASLQSEPGGAVVERSGGDPGELSTLYAVADYQSECSRVFTRSDAVLFVATELGWPWKAARLARIVPRRLRDRAYDFVARHRYRVFGRYDRCPVPRPEFRTRFID
jgi:predicted DCC family thiol-disulfide oxidoreductase YuxK